MMPFCFVHPHSFAPAPNQIPGGGNNWPMFGYWPGSYRLDAGASGSSVPAEEITDNCHDLNTVVDDDDEEVDNGRGLELELPDLNMYPRVPPN
ncbi:unnamed protein product [Amaranthus hypochondriacus]